MAIARRVNLSLFGLNLAAASRSQSQTRPELHRFAKSMLQFTMAVLRSRRSRKDRLQRSGNAPVLRSPSLELDCYVIALELWGATRRVEAAFEVCLALSLQRRDFAQMKASFSVDQLLFCCANDAAAHSHWAY